jgi:hypothetical protein
MGNTIPPGGDSGLRRSSGYSTRRGDSLRRRMLAPADNVGASLEPRLFRVKSASWISRADPEAMKTKCGKVWDYSRDAWAHRQQRDSCGRSTTSSWTATIRASIVKEKRPWYEPFASSLRFLSALRGSCTQRWRCSPSFDHDLRGGARPSSIEMRTIDPLDLRAALDRDAAP